MSPNHVPELDKEYLFTNLIELEDYGNLLEFINDGWIECNYIDTPDDDDRICYDEDHNYDLCLNNGWEEYIKEQQGQKTSLDKPIGEGGTALSDMMQADRDVLLDNLENQDLTPGRKQDAIDAIQALKVRELLVFPRKTIKSIFYLRTIIQMN